MKTLIRLMMGALAVALLTFAAQAHADDLPPRPTPSPSAPAPDVATITLALNGTPNGAYTVVQWKDPSGGWHNVEGWQHAVDASQQVRWAVYPRDFGDGPFRWAVYTRAWGTLLGVTPDFQLPCCAGATLSMRTVP